MAPADDVIIIEDGGDDLPLSSPDDQAPPPSSKKKIIIIAAAATSAVLLFGGIGAYLLLKPAPPVETVTPEKIKKAPPKAHGATLEPSEVEQLIQKANLLYQKGDKEKALAIYEEVSQYSDAVSQYNLGVAKLKESDFTSALTHFENALQNNEQKCPAALNAAVCALNLNDQQKFKTYILMAQEHLPQEVNSPLYSYYYALIHYYKAQYYEALAALTHPTSQEYPHTTQALQAKLSYMFGDTQTPLRILSKQKDLANELSIGLLHAQNGDYPQAITHLSKAATLSTTRSQALNALALVQIKSGLYKDASQTLRQFQDEGYKPLYPVQTLLKPSLFQIDAAQEHFKGRLLSDKIFLSQLIFYFSPYKVFNPDQTITDIRKGELGLLKDEPTIAKAYLTRSSILSKANIQIAQALRLAVNYRLESAYKLLSDVEKVYPRHAILHYNIALVLAQMGHYPEAYTHFQKAYNLDPKNLLAGLLALYTGDLINADTQRTANSLQADLFGKESLPHDQLYLVALKYYFDNNIPAALDTITKHSDSSSPLVHVLKLIIANKANDTQQLLMASKKLVSLQPDDLMANFLSILTTYKGESVKTIAAQGQLFFQKDRLDWRSLYYGPLVTRERIVEFAFLTGMLPRIEPQLQDRLLNEKEERIGLAKALALCDVYLMKFPKADKIYRELIDTKNVFDSRTLFLAAIASLGANHHSDTIGFLDLAKLRDPRNDEARFGLAILNLEAGNLPVTIKALDLISDPNFHSSTFDFALAIPQRDERKNTH